MQTAFLPIEWLLDELAWGPGGGEPLLEELDEGGPGGKVLEVHCTQGVWLAPCDGSQHASAMDAMRHELTRHLADCGATAGEGVDQGPLAEEEMEELLAHIEYRGTVNAG